jgi:hypothetical protein
MFSPKASVRFFGAPRATNAQKRALRVPAPDRMTQAAGAWLQRKSRCPVPHPSGARQPRPPQRAPARNSKGLGRAGPVAGGNAAVIDANLGKS